ncbi:MAG: RsmE family RNA methyltransferase [Spirochaetes bacterium]|nr:RsmE family RNA methyltransferase [Spirochaetota bacterium]
MNLILLDSPSTFGVFHKEDRRYTHIYRILGGKVGSALKAGVVNGPIGTLEILELSEQFLRYRFLPTEEPISPYPIEVLLGAMRPIVARRLLKDLTALGVKGIYLVKADLSEGSYLQSSLWKNREYETYLREGAEQGGNTILPIVKLYPNVEHGLREWSEEGKNLVLDPGASESLFSIQKEWMSLNDGPPVLRVAIGPERGWSGRELDLFIRNGFIPCRMGSRVLRTETAALVVVGILVMQWEER